MGQHVRGTVDVFPEHIRIEVVLPGLLAGMAEKVAEKLELQAFVVCRYMETGMHLHLLDKDADTKGYSLTPHGALLTDSGYLRDFMLMINEETRFAWRAR